jgi:hypothetical protein
MPTWIRKTYDMVHAVLLSIGIAIAVMLLLNIPHMREQVQQAAAQRALRVAQENREHCERFGLQAGDHSHMICVLELNRMRDDSVRDASATW